MPTILYLLYMAEITFDICLEFFQRNYSLSLVRILSFDDDEDLH